MNPKKILSRVQQEFSQLIPKSMIMTRKLLALACEKVLNEPEEDRPEEGTGTDSPRNDQEDDGAEGLVRDQDSRQQVPERPT